MNGKDSVKATEIMEINDNGETVPVAEGPKEDEIPKRKVQIDELPPIKIRKYRFHDKFEKKQGLLQPSQFNIMNESSNAFFGNINP